MVKKRNRFKQTTTLEHRLQQFADELRRQAKAVPPGAEKTDLMRRIRTSETASRLEAMMKAKTFELPSEPCDRTRRSA
jgi:hypothetical protein